MLGSSHMSLHHCASSVRDVGLAAWNAANTVDPSRARRRPNTGIGMGGVERSNRRVPKMVEIKTDAQLDAMREAGRVVGRALEAVRAAADVKVSLRELDEVARGVLRAAGASSPFLNYRPHFAPTPFPPVISTSLND